MNTVQVASPSLTPWQRFWFIAERGSSLQPVRWGLCIIACWYFGSHWADISFWFSGNGILSTSQLQRFVDAGDLGQTVRWRPSLLYWIESPLALRAFLLFGIVAAVWAAVARQARWACVMLWLAFLCVANRSLLIEGLEELALAFGLAYLALSSFAVPHAWCGALARRLIQVHTCLLIGFSGIVMLSASIWWDGSGSMALAAPVGRRLFDLTQVLDNPLIYESITHAIQFVSIAAAILIWIPRFRKLAWCSLYGWCLVMALLSSQWMYFSTIAVLLLSFRSTPSSAE